MKYYEDGYQRNGWCNWCDRGDYCSCDRCYEHRPEPLKGNSAQFINTVRQDVIGKAAEKVDFNSTEVHADRGIKLLPPNDIRLEKGRYLVAYYLTIKNKHDEDDSYIAKLKLGEVDLSYTTSQVGVEDDDSVGNLGKTNLVEVVEHSTLQLFVSGAHQDSKYQIQDASIVIQRID